MRSLLSLEILYTVESGFSIPEFTRNMVILPAYGSANVLNTNAEKASSLEGFRSTSSLVLGFCPTTAGRSIGDGINSIIASVTWLTPIFWTAVPHKTGII